MSVHIASVYYPPSRTVRGLALIEAEAHAEVLRLNSRAGVFALSLATWHGMRIVRRDSARADS